MADLLCCCGHPYQLHLPGGGSCTASSGGCDCRGFTRRTRLADEVPGITPEFPPAPAVQGSEKPATNSAVETAAMRADARSHPNRPHPYCPSCVDSVIRLADALDRARETLREAQRSGSAWGRRAVAAEAEVERLRDVQLAQRERAEQADAELVEWKAAHARALRDREAVEREMDARWVERNGRILQLADQRDALVDVLQGILQDPSTEMQPMRIAAAHAALADPQPVESAAGGLHEQGRRLASQRDDLIAAGVDPADLLVPLAPAATGERHEWVPPPGGGWNCGALVANPRWPNERCGVIWSDHKVHLPPADAPPADGGRR